ncbi:flagellar filament capping protein FliD [Thalassobacillus hwangdonensis]|uniref:Flagellar hook-associated protein 2 n=1 Tax=Thalassobacillus hwangdonensis TaxID=546108 RepID=A0ABW3L5K1_9BACI
MNNMRIGGLASGIDTDSIVKDLMKVERMPLDKLTKEKQSLEWKRDAYREMNTLLFELRNLSIDMTLSKNYKSKSVTSSNEQNVSATATPASGDNSYTISKVDQLATAATKISNGSISNTNKIDPSLGLMHAENNFATPITWNYGVMESETIKVTEERNDIALTHTYGNFTNSQNMNVLVDGKNYTVNTTATSEADLAEGEVWLNTSTGVLTFKDPLSKNNNVEVDYYLDQKIADFTGNGTQKVFSLGKRGIEESTFNGGTTITVGTTPYTITTEPDVFESQAADANIVLLDETAGNLVFKDAIADGESFSVSFQQKYGTFGLETYDEEGNASKLNFAFDGSKSLNNVINDINNSDIGVNAFYDSFSDKLTLTRDQTGNLNDSGDEIITSGTFLNNVLGFAGVTEDGGQNASFTINGLSTERFSNTFEINDVTFTLKNTFDSTVAGSGHAPATIGVSTDSEKVFENIKGFIEKYNETIGKINEKLNEEYYRDYKPLTDEEREAMTEKQAELWDEKAQSGLLKRDPLLSGGLSQLRTDFYSPISNISTQFSQLAQIGITTSSNYREGGKLEINEADLKKAIQDDPEAVKELFTANGDTYQEKGILRRMQDSLKGTMDRIYERAGRTTYTNEQFTMGRNLKDMNDQIDRFQDRLVQIEDRYWRQFTEMEKAIQRMNSQSSQLMNYFGGGM